MGPKPPKTVFVCQHCGFRTGKWLGKCPECQAWSSFLEEMVVVDNRPRGSASLAGRSQPIPLLTLAATPEDRWPTGIVEFDRAVGGGVVAGSVVLLGGDPGIGKSTLMLQVLDRLCQEGATGLYISGEESAAQLKLRADRLGITASTLLVATETCLENILQLLETNRPKFLVLDSIQTLYAAALPATPGSITQIRETAFQLVQVAKRSAIAVFLIGHVTKEGAIAGPKVLEHLVDTVLYFEGDRSHTYRLLRTVKNRFGPSQELGVFEMHDTGITEVANPSALFLSERSLEAPGSVVVASIEGSRPILVEVQALVTPTNLAMPRRQTSGVEAARLSLLVAVLEKRLGLNFGGQDIFVNVAGGVRLSEPAADLGIVAALTSSLLDRPVAGDTLIFGEVGLTGEVRTVNQVDLRLKEGVKLGFRRAVIARPRQDQLLTGGDLQISEVGRVQEALRHLFGPDLPEC